MTTNTITPNVDYIEDGVTLNHPVPFKFLADTDLIVQRITGGVATTLTLGVDYTAAGAGDDAGGTLTKASGGTSGVTLRIKRATTRSQGFDYTPNDTFPAESHETALDRQSLVNQEQDVDIQDTKTRSFLVPEGESGAELDLAADRANKFLAFDIDGNPISSAGTGADAGLRGDLGNSVLGALLIAWKAGGLGAVARTIWARLNELPLSVTDFGATGDGLTDDRAAIQAAIDACSAAGGGDVLFPTPSNNYRIEGSVKVPILVNLVGQGRYCYVVARAGIYTASAAFLVNTTDGTDWVTSNPNNQSSIFRNFRIETDQTGIAAFKFNGSSVWIDCKFAFWDQAIVGGALYNDLVRLDRCFFMHTVQKATHQVELGGLGDGVLIQNCHFPNVGNDPGTPLRSIKITNNGYAIENCLLGDVHIELCTSSSKIESCGADGGQIYVLNSNINLKDTALSKLDTTSALVLDNTTGFPYYASLDGVLFSHDVARGSWQPREYDVAVDTGFVVSFKNVFARTLNSLSPASRNLQGVKLATIGGSALAAFNNYSYIFSERSVMHNQSMRTNPFSIDTPTSALNLLGATYEFSAAEWEGASATYYYKAVLYYDTGRAVGRNDSSAEVSRAAVNAGSAIGLDINEGNYPTAKIIRLYRGTATGSYDAYADIPIVNANYLVDIGPHVSGVTWLSRAAGAVDAFNNYTIGGFAIRDGLATFYASAPPTVGAWLRGDRTIERNPSAGGNRGWLNVAAGSPGTWPKFGVIATGQAYTPSNVTTSRSFDADTVTTQELADVVGTLIADLQGPGVVS